MRKAIWGIYASAIAGLFATEAAFYLGEWSPWKRLAGLFWVLCSVVTVLTAWVSAFTPFLTRGFWALPHRAWYLLAFFLPPILILFDGGGIRFTSVGQEGLVQLACAMDLLHRDPSLGVFRMEYARYLDRQYLLNSIPSCLFGPSIWAERLGNSMFYIGGYLFFLSSLVTLFRGRKSSDPLFLAGFCGMMIALGQYTLLNARMFEQTMMPIGVTLFFLAALIGFLAESGPLRYLWLTWSFGFFPECYTPALGGWVLALGVLLYLIIRQRRRDLVPVVLYGIACLWIACQITWKTDPGVFAAKFRMGTEHLTAADRTLRYLQGFRALVGTDCTLIPVPLLFAIVAACALAWRYRDYRYAAVCAWAAAIACLSITLMGAFFNFPKDNLQRAMTIIPPLALGAVLLIDRYLSDPSTAQATAAGVKAIMSVSMGYMVVTGVSTVFLVRTFYSVNTVSDFDEIVSRIDEVARSPAEARPTRVYLVPPLHIDLQPALQYFVPGAQAVYAKPPAGERIAGAYVFSYAKDAADRFEDEIVPSRHPRPFIRMDRE